MTRTLAEMTWPDVAAAVAGGATTVILPLGATEQHGTHLPLGTDSFRAAVLAERLANAIPQALVAPVLPVGCSDEHEGFAGLLSLDHATLAQVILDCGRRLAGWGARRLLLLSAHGGNGEAIERARARLAESVPSLRVTNLASAAIAECVLAIAAADGISGDAVGLHAGEGETSEMLAIRPDLVCLQRMVSGYEGRMADIMPQLQRSGVKSVTPTGTLGDARQADAARGARYLAAQIEAIRHSLMDEAANRTRTVLS